MSTIFSLSNLQESTVYQYDNILQESEDISYGSIVYSYLNEMNIEYGNATRKLNKTILESNGNYRVINEGFSNFIATAKEIIKKFIEYIKSLFDRFCNALNKFVLSDKYILKHEKEFVNFTTQDEFEIDGYNFTIDPTVPATKVLVYFNEDFLKINFDLKNGGEGKTLKDIINNNYQELQREIENGKYDQVRADVIGQNMPIAEEDFHQECFELFRDGESTTSMINITQSKVLESLGRFKNYKEVEKNVKKTRSALEKEYKELENKISKMITKSNLDDIKKQIEIKLNDNYEMNGEIPQRELVATQEDLTKLDIYIKAKINEVQVISNIHSLAFGSKLDALKDQYKQDKKILYMARNNILKVHKEGV